MCFHHARTHARTHARILPRYTLTSLLFTGQKNCARPRPQRRSEGGAARARRQALALLCGGEGHARVGRRAPQGGCGRCAYRRGKGMCICDYACLHKFRDTACTCIVTGKPSLATFAVLLTHAHMHASCDAFTHTYRNRYRSL